MKKFFFILIFVVSGCTDQTDPKLLFEQGKYEEAYRLWLPLAESGDLYAQNYIGIQYYIGFGVKKDYKKAKEWFEKAASGGFADAQYNLGAMYENGESVKTSYIDAYMWFHAANENGNTNAAPRMLALRQEYKLFQPQVEYAEKIAKDFIKKE